jgi:polysaccharide export outer membrane protein
MPSPLPLIVRVLPRVLCASFVVVTALATGGPAVAQNPIGAGSVPGGEYEIGPEDLLEVSVWKEKDLQREVLVRPDGWLTFPLVGNIRAKGRTALDVQEEITHRLRKYIPDPVVTVSIKKVAGYKIYVIGKVNKPGEYVVGRYVDVLQALTLAGGLTPFAAEGDIRVLRKQETEDGTVKETVLPFDYADVKKGRGLQQNIFLKSGDVVVVP